MKYAKINNIYAFMYSNCKKLLKIAVPYDDFGNDSFLVEFIIPFRYEDQTYTVDKHCIAHFDDFTCTIETEELKFYEKTLEKKWINYMNKTFKDYKRDLSQLNKRNKLIKEMSKNYNGEKPKLYIVKDETVKEV